MSTTNGTAVAPPRDVRFLAQQVVDAKREAVGPRAAAVVDQARALLRDYVAEWRFEDPEGCAAYMASLQRRADVTS